MIRLSGTRGREVEPTKNLDCNLLARKGWRRSLSASLVQHKIHSIVTYVENPLIKRFAGEKDDLLGMSRAIGGVKTDDPNISADLGILFKPLPRVPLLLLFWDAVEDEGFETQIKLLFDETIKEHLDIESIFF